MENEIFPSDVVLTRKRTNREKTYKFVCFIPRGETAVCARCQAYTIMNRLQFNVITQDSADKPLETRAVKLKF